MSESSLKQLVRDRKATIFYIHGTARSGSTIAEVVFSRLCDRAIHQPWRGILQHRGGRNRPNKLKFDEDIYEAGCELISKHIREILSTQSHATVLVKELAGFFKPSIWKSWVEIPEKFILTIRDPCSQYLSWLAAMTDKIFHGQGKIQENYKMVLEKAEIVEDSILPPEWEGTTITCNQNAWNALLNDALYLYEYLPETASKLTIIEASLLRKDPDYVVAKAIEQLRLNISPDWFSPDNLERHSQGQIVDLRDVNRPMVRKARNSKRIEPLSQENKFDCSLLPAKSRQHLQQIIPIYLDLLYAPENVSMPSLEQLQKPVAGNGSLKLQQANPFLAYAIALFYQQQLMSNAKHHFSSVSNLQKAVDLYWQPSNIQESVKQI